MSNIARDYSKYCDVDLQSKLQPINKCIDGMLGRLEEVQTMMSFVLRDRNDSVKVLSALLDYNEELTDLFKKVDVVERLIEHIKGNLDKLEDDVERAEVRLGGVESSTTTKVSNIFTPFFKKSHEKKSTNQQVLEIFRTEDYFHDGDVL